VLTVRYLILFLLLAPRLVSQVDEARLLRAISAVESNCNPAAVGSHGERGAEQMLPAMRRHYGTPMAMLHDLERQLPRIGIDPTPYTLALGYHLGITKLARREIPDSAVAYAQRVRAIYISP